MFFVELTKPCVAEKHISFIAQLFNLES